VFGCQLRCLFCWYIARSIIYPSVKKIKGSQKKKKKSVIRNGRWEHVDEREKVGYGTEMKEGAARSSAVAKLLPKSLTSLDSGVCGTLYMWHTVRSPPDSLKPSMKYLAMQKMKENVQIFKKNEYVMMERSRRKLSSKSRQLVRAILTQLPGCQDAPVHNSEARAPVRARVLVWARALHVFLKYALYPRPCTRYTPQLIRERKKTPSYI
jgi:hypothetical protein